VFIELLTIESPPNIFPLYVANNNEDVVSRGTTFKASAFEITLPNQDPEKLPDLNLTIQNVDTKIMEYIRMFEYPPVMKLEIVTSIDLDLVEVAVDFLTLKSVQYNQFEITGSLKIENWLGRKFGDSYDPVQFPGLFAI